MLKNNVIAGGLMNDQKLNASSKNDKSHAIVENRKLHIK